MKRNSFITAGIRKHKLARGSAPKKFPARLLRRRLEISMTMESLMIHSMLNIAHWRLRRGRHSGMRRKSCATAGTL